MKKHPKIATKSIKISYSTILVDGCIIIVFTCLYQCGFFERKKRKELNAFKRKTQMSIRSARSARSGVGAGSVKSHRSITTGSFRVKKMGDDHEKLHDKNVADEDENISPEENNKC